MRQLGKGFTGIAARVGLAAAASGCGGWVDLQSPEDGAGGLSNASGGTSSSVPTRGSSGGQSTGTVVGRSGGSSTGGGQATGGTVAAGGEPGVSPLEVLGAGAPTRFPPGADAPGVTWTASVKVTAGSLALGALAGSTGYCFRKPLSGNTCNWMTEEPFVWTEAAGFVTLDVGDLPGLSYFSSNVTSDGKTVVGSFRTPDDAFGLFRWTAVGGATRLGEPPGSPGYEYLSDDGKTVAGMFKGNDKGHVNFLWSESNGFQVLNEAVGWPANSEVRALSADGRVLAGATVGGDQARVFRYTSSSVEQLGAFPTFPNCDLGYIGSLTRDGKAIFGSCTSEDQQSSQAFRWTDGSGLAGLSSESCQMRSVLAVAPSGTSAFGVGTCSSARGLVRWQQGAASPSLLSAPAGFEFDGVSATSHDGSAAIGALRLVSGDASEPPLPGDPLPAPSEPQAFRWRESDGVVRLPLASGQSYSSANAIAPSGEVVVGRAGPSSNDAKAVLWDAAGQLELESYLESAGVALQGVELNTAQDVVVRGNAIHILGYTDAPNFAGAWLVHIPLVR